MIVNDLYAYSCEVGSIFDVFLPKYKATGVPRGFEFVLFKTEWDVNVNKSIQRINGWHIGGKWISIQMPKYTRRVNGRQNMNKNPPGGRKALDDAERKQRQSLHEEF